jgi:dihydroorotase
MSILIKNGRVVDPANGVNEIIDILIEDGKISKISKNMTPEADTVIEATDRIVMPGIVDMHVHLREPGREDKETIASGTKAALKGGVTSVLAMPNTTPAIDSVEQVKKLKNIIHKSAHANVLIAATITQGRLGNEIVDVGSLKKDGVIAITDDGSSVDSDEVMLKALQTAKREGMLVICHCEDKALSNQGVMNLGFMSTQLGLRGIPKEAEYKSVQRDIQLAAQAGAAIHIAHVSTKESCDLIAEAKRKGMPVSAETAPHYFSLTEEAVSGYDTNKKINPPLRTEEDVRAIKEGLKDGTIDVIASDHAPHTENEKEIEFDRAEFGVIGLETELAVSITELLNTGSTFGKDAVLDWPGLVKKLSLNPAKILGVNKGALGVGCDADIIVVDPDREWKVTKDSFVSKSKNSAFLGRTLKGVVEYTICSGKITYRL